MHAVSCPGTVSDMSPPQSNSEEPLLTPAQFVPGVGPARAELLSKLGIDTVENLLWFLPRDVLDLTKVTHILDVQAEKLQTIRGSVVDRDARELSNGRTLVAVLLDCGRGFLRGLWFNQPWMLKKFTEGESVVFSGKPKRHAGRWEISNPQVQWLEDDREDAHGGVLPRYPLTEGLKMHEVRRLTRTAVEMFVEFVPEYIPDSIRENLNLAGIRAAIGQIHCPSTVAEYQAGCGRLIFDDLFEFQLALAIRRRAWRKDENAPRLPTTAKIDSRIRRLFPFDLTAGQDDAVAQIVADFDSGKPMHRLLQADVGAGKTAIAIYAALVAVAAGYQAVLMAPTELLATQHWQTVESILTQSRVNRTLLTGNLTAAQRKTALNNIASGEVQLIVGTQAIIQKDVAFHKLGLVVIDEQHKFGVEQRARFSVAEESPHVLVMTATPIPRSLCMTQFGDLDITVISDMPPGRQKVVTSRVHNSGTQRRAWDFVKQQIHSGRQAYVVCPRVEGDLVDTNGLVSAEELNRSLSIGELRDFSVGMVHGQMDRKERRDVMDAFRYGELQVLVSTTVVEVGVDVPNATLMIIYQAECFGLSQLHQLRGRIARGKHQGYCFLFSEAKTDDAAKRISALEQHSDGFRIAEVDFELRGPGDILGTRQHGQLPLKVADLIRDAKVLAQARKAAFSIVDSGDFDTPEFAPLKIRVLERFGKLMDLPRSG